MLRILFVFMLLCPLPALAELKVVASIAPLAAIAQEVAGTQARVTTLMGPQDSPHTYQLKPSNAAQLEAADVIFWASDDVETSLDKVLDDNRKAVELVELPGLQLLQIREGGLWEEDDDHPHDHNAPHHQDDDEDPHFWLNPFNAVVIAKAMAEKFAALDAANAETYRNNAHAFAQELAGVDAAIKTRLSKFANRGFIVFHDAYQYFEKAYHLNAVGSITLSPEVPPSAARIAALQARIRENKVVCVFAEPQFKADLVQTLVHGSTAKTGLLSVDSGEAKTYRAYLLDLTQRFEDCLAP